MQRYLQGSREMPCIPNLLNLEFYAFELWHGVVSPEARTVGLTGGPTYGGTPELVGIPIFHHPPTAHMGKLLGKAKHGHLLAASLAAEAPQATPLLQLRASHSFVLGAVDFVLSGSPNSPA